MKNIDWDERRYQIILNLTKNVTISDRSGVPYREIEAMADELISYMQIKSDGCQGFDDKISSIIETIKKTPEFINKSCKPFGWSNPEFDRGVTKATDFIVNVIQKLKEDEKV